MKLDYQKLQSYFAEPLPALGKLAEALTIHAFEVENGEVKILPDRAAEFGDNLALAREIGSVLDRPLKENTVMRGNQPVIKFTPANINNLLGLDLNGDEITKLLERVYVRNGQPADHRTDITTVADLADEVVRLYGYDKLPSILPAKVVPAPDDANFILANQVRAKLLAEDSVEIYGYSFVSSGEVEIEKPLASDKKFLRTNLSDNLQAKIKYNQQFDLFGAEPKLFEIGTVFLKDREEVQVATNESEKLLSEFTAEPAPDLATFLTKNKYQPFSVYPRIIRDIAVWVPLSTTPEEVMTIIRENAGDLLAEGPALFDQFEKDPRQSLAFRMAFQAPDRTLSDEEVNAVIGKLIVKLDKVSSWQVRK